MLQIVLLVVAVTCFIISALPALAPNWNRIVSLGLAAFAASMIRW